MANIKSAIKRSRQSEKRRNHNTSVTSDIKTKQKNARAAIESGAAADEVKSSISKLASALDKAAKRGIIHKNAANRKKANIARIAKNAVAAAS
ncbi:MAG: 30S ribosomal protein S20 [Chthoniobacterales bacterium]